MKERIWFTIWIGFFLFTLIADRKQASGADIDFLLDRGRQAFYWSVEQENQVDTTLKVFQEISRREPAYKGLAMTYIGAAYTLKGKHAFLPQKKFGYVRDGVLIMEQGLQEAPGDLEALFIFGMTCYHLPFFFGRRNEAMQALRRIVGLLEKGYQQYDPRLVLNVVRFIEEEITLNSRERLIIHTIIEDIGDQ